MPLKPKKIPMRMCVGCREMRPKKELIRVVRTPEGGVIMDPGGKSSGRGAYICPKKECLKAAEKTKALQRALETAIEESVFESLMKRLEEYDEQ